MKHQRLSLYNWINCEIDDDITHKDISADLFDKIVSKLNKLNIEITDIQSFYKEFVVYLYTHSSKKQYSF